MLIRSLKWQLPAGVVLITGLVLVSFLVVARREVQSALIHAHEDRAQAAAGQLAMLLADTARQRQQELRGLATHPDIRAVLVNPSSDALLRAREALRSAETSNTPQRIDIWSQGARVLSVVSEHADAVWPPDAPPAPRESSDFLAPHALLLNRVVAAVPSAAGHPAGHLVWLRSVVIRPDPAFLASLVGRQARVKMGSLSGTGWTDLSASTQAPGIDLQRAGPGGYRDAEGRAYIGALAPVAGTDWAVWVEFPRASVVAPAVPYLARLAMVSALLLVLATLLSRWLTGRLARRVASVTHAAESVAKGDYSNPVDAGPRDEIGRLGAAFNAMTQRLGTDADARVAAEAALSEREASFRALFAANPHPMWVFDAETLRFLEVNASAIAHYGYSRDAFLSMAITDIRPPGAVAPLLDHIQKHPRGLGRVTQWQHVTRDGRCIDVDVASHALTFEGRPAVLVVAQDITQRLSLEAQLRQGQKMEAVGRLAGGVAHDFNNLLTAILGYAELAGEKFPADHPVREDLSEIQKAGNSAAALTRQLLAFSRKQLRRPEPLDLNAVVQSVESMLQRVIGEHIALETGLASPLGAVLADPNQLEQVVMNLAVNARDAMPAGGRMTIETANVTLDAAYAAQHADVTPGDYVLLAVSDTGTGIDADARAHIFEPFFTTKGRGEGTGLGLATVYGIVKQTGGSIDVYSEAGRGTAFKIYFPRATEAAQTGAAPSVAHTTAGTETILVAEDQPEVRAVARAILYRHGYRVIDAAGGREALAIIEERGDAIDLLLTDIVMPEMTGPELVAASQAVKRGIRVLYTSGYADQAVTRSGVLESDAEFIQKPYTAAALLSRIRQVLDKQNQ